MIVAEDRPMSASPDARGSFLWGPLTPFALAVAVAAAVLDQAAKLWLLYAVDLPARGIVRLTPFLDLVLTWNTGISWGLFRQEGPLGQGALLALRAIADFVLFHITTASFSFNWYVFNLADVAIVAGVIGLLFETLMGTGAAKAP